MVALIWCLLALSAVAQADDNYWYHWSDSAEKKDCDDKIWRFKLESEWGGYEYIDDNGYLQGFNQDMIEKVCAKAGKKCYWTVDTMDNCWQATKGVERPGKGLMGGWYDGCVGLYPTPERQNSFDFTTAFLRKSEGTGVMFGLRSERSTNVADLKGKKIGFLEGWAYTPKCVSREPNLINNQMDDYEAVWYDHPDKAEKALKDKEIDYYILASGISPKNKDIIRKGPAIHCASGGSAIMVRYGSGVIGWWNDAVAAMRKSGEWDEMCTQAKRDHGHMGRLDCDL